MEGDHVPLTPLGQPTILAMKGKDGETMLCTHLTHICSDMNKEIFNHNAGQR